MLEDLAAKRRTRRGGRRIADGDISHRDSADARLVDHRSQAGDGNREALPPGVVTGVHESGDASVDVQERAARLPHVGRGREPQHLSAIREAQRALHSAVAEREPPARIPHEENPITGVGVGVRQGHGQQAGPGRHEERDIRGILAVDAADVELLVSAPSHERDRVAREVRVGEHDVRADADARAGVERTTTSAVDANDLRDRPLVRQHWWRPERGSRV